MKTDQLDWVHPRVEELGALLSRQDAMQDRDRWLSLMQEYNRLSPLDAVLREIQALEREYAEAELLEQEDGFAEMAAQEKRRIGAQMEEKRAELAGLLDTAGGDDRSAIMEIRSGAGGEEAALFAAMLLRMYTRYAEKQGWQTELLDLSPTEMGGVKEAVFSVSGKNVLQRLEGESGVHRIQRIPVTESNGKRQTSTATVAVLPEATDVDVQIDPGDLRIDVYRASGHGGQYINKTDSAVRITHLPTGIVATCQDEKSQLRNKEKAMEVLRTRLYDHLRRQSESSYADNRKSQVGTGDRSERIRTDNFNDGRITDHRLGKTIYSVDAFLDGDMDVLIEPLLQMRREKEAKEANDSMRGTL